MIHFGQAPPPGASQNRSYRGEAHRNAFASRPANLGAPARWRSATRSHLDFGGFCLRAAVSSTALVTAGRRRSKIETRKSSADCTVTPASRSRATGKSFVLRVSNTSTSPPRHAAACTRSSGSGDSESSSNGKYRSGLRRPRSKNCLMTRAMDAADSEERSFSLTITRSHSPSNSSVHTQVITRSSAIVRSVSITVNGKSSFVSTKTRGARATPIRCRRVQRRPEQRAALRDRRAGAGARRGRQSRRRRGCDDECCRGDAETRALRPRTTGRRTDG